MKHIRTVSLLFALSACGAALAQTGSMKDMEMHKNMPMDMHAEGKEQNETQKGGTHQATGIVKAVDPTKGVVTLVHEPIKSLNWPAMTMGFAVKDKAMLDQLKVGDKVTVELTQQGSKYVISAVK